MKYVKSYIGKNWVTITPVGDHE